MLALKTALAGKAGVPTLIFDEIDTGISGETAMQVARVMRKTSEKRQLIAITHLAQIAAAGDHHFLIAKHTEGKTTHSTVENISGKERNEALARMIAGAHSGTAASKAAKDLLAAFH